MTAPVLIGIAGASCSGKTTLAHNLAAHLAGKAVVISLDSYYRDYASLSPTAQANFNFDAPAALDCDLLLAQLQKFAGGEAIEKPVYRFSDHSRAPRGERLEPANFAIVEGLFALYWEEVRSLFQLGVFIDVADETCLDRRLKRDQTERGRSRQSILAQYDKQVRPMYVRHVLPTRDRANLVLPGHTTAKNAVASVLHYLEKTNSIIDLDHTASEDAYI